MRDPGADPRKVSPSTSDDDEPISPRGSGSFHLRIINSNTYGGIFVDLGNLNFNEIRDAYALLDRKYLDISFASSNSLAIPQRGFLSS